MVRRDMDHAMTRTSGQGYLSWEDTSLDRHSQCELSGSSWTKAGGWPCMAKTIWSKISIPECSAELTQLGKGTSIFLSMKYKSICQTPTRVAHDAVGFKCKWWIVLFGSSRFFYHWLSKRETIDKYCSFSLDSASMYSSSETCLLLSHGVHFLAWWTVCVWGIGVLTMLWLIHPEA